MRVGAFDFELVDARDATVASVLSEFNDLFPDDFYPLQRQHFQNGLWFVATHVAPERRVVGFAGSVPFAPFNDFLYFKRVAVDPKYRGNSLQRIFMQLTEGAARQSGYSHMISTTDVANIYSANNFIKTGWQLTRPEKPWEPNSLYWIKKLTSL